GRFAQSCEISEKALNAFGDRVGADVCRLLANSGAAAGLSGDYDKGERTTLRALAMAERVGDDATLGFALYERCCHSWAFGRFAAAVESGMRGAELLRRSGDLWN